MATARIRFDLPPEGQELLEATRGLAERFDVPVEDLDATPEVILVDGLAEARVDELEQALHDLGYTELGPEDETREALNARLAPALDRFLAEAREALPSAVFEAMEDGAWDETGGATIATTIEGPSPFALELLRALTSFDGDIALGSRDYGAGLARRLLHYRLRMLNLSQAAIGETADDRIAAALGALRAVPGFEDVSDRSVLDILGDGGELFRRFDTAIGRSPLVFRYFAESAPGEVGFDDLIVDTNGRFEDDAGFLRRLRTEPDDRARDALPLVEAQFHRHANGFGIELLQLGLWMQGYYEGRLDSWWGPMSDRALRHFLEAHDIDRREVLLGLGDGYWAVNFTGIARQLFPPLAPDAAADAPPAEDAPIFHETGRMEPPERHAASRSLWQDIRDGFRRAVRTGRRIALGVRSLARAAWNGVKRGLAFASSTLGDVFASAKAMVKLAFRSAREAIGGLTRSIRRFIHFVIGKPIVTVDANGNPAAMSQYAADRDGFLWTDPTKPAAVAEHQRVIARLVRGFQIFMRLLGKGAGYLILALTGPVNWARLAFKLFGDLVALTRALAAQDGLAALA